MLTFPAKGSVKGHFSCWSSSLDRNGIKVRKRNCKEGDAQGRGAAILCHGPMKATKFQHAAGVWNWPLPFCSFMEKAGWALYWIWNLELSPMAGRGGWAIEGTLCSLFPRIQNVLLSLPPARDWPLCRTDLAAAALGVPQWDWAVPAPIHFLPKVEMGLWAPWKVKAWLGCAAGLEGMAASPACPFPGAPSPPPLGFSRPPKASPLLIWSLGKKAVNKIWSGGMGWTPTFPNALLQYTGGGGKK